MAKRAAYCAMLTALAMIFGYVESLIPFHVGIPGMKLGLANIVIVVALYLLPVRQVLLIQTARIVAVAFLFGNMSMMLYSLAGGFLSLLVMALLKRAGGFSMTGVSIAGGVSHNVGQLAVAAAVIEDFKVLSYLPVLLAAGLATGCLTGMLAGRMKPAIDRYRSG